VKELPGYLHGCYGFILVPISGCIEEQVVSKRTWLHSNVPHEIDPWLHEQRNE
jgi:hypothetical protein